MYEKLKRCYHNKYRQFYEDQSLTWQVNWHKYCHKSVKDSQCFFFIIKVNIFEKLSAFWNVFTWLKCCTYEKTNTLNTFYNILQYFNYHYTWMYIYSKNSLLSVIQKESPVEWKNITIELRPHLTRDFFKPSF